MDTIPGLSYSSGGIYIPSIAAKRGWDSYKQTDSKLVKTTAVKKKNNGRRSTSEEVAIHNQRNPALNVNFGNRSKTFRVCCLKADVPPSKRQAAKFKKGIGAAFAELRNITPDDMKQVR